LKDLLRSFAATAVIQFANILSGIMLARILLPQGRGELAAIMLWPSVIAAIGQLGLSEATTFCAAQRPKEPSYVFMSALGLSVIFAAISLLCGWIVVLVVAAGFSPEAQFAAFIYLGFIPLNFFGLTIGALHQGSLSIVRWNFYRITVHVAYPALIAVFYLAGWASVLSMACAMLISNVILIAVGLLLARGKQWLVLKPSREGMRALMSFGVRAHFANVVSMLSERADQLLISLLLPAASLGIYVVANTVARGASAVGDTLSVLAFPKVAHATDVAFGRAIALKYMRATFLLSVPIAIIGITLAPWLVVLVFGAQYQSGIGVTQILILSTVPLNMKIMLSATLKAFNRSMDVGMAQTVALLISVALLACLLPVWGLVGAAVSFLVTQMVSSAMLLVQAHRKLNFMMRDLILPMRGDIAEAFTGMLHIFSRAKFPAPTEK
jgi:O-antigen/teichoic acid export membrane protein